MNTENKIQATDPKRLSDDKVKKINSVRSQRDKCKADLEREIKRMDELQVEQRDLSKRIDDNRNAMTTLRYQHGAFVEELRLLSL